LLVTFGAALALGLVLALAPFAPPLPVLVAVVVTVTLGAALLYGGLRRVQDRVDSALSSLLATGQGTADRAGRQDPSQGLLLPTRGLEGSALREVALGARSAAVGRSLREINLRHRTGASALAVVNRGKRLLHPGPETRLEPGASVVLLGEPEQVAAAEQLLQAEAPEETASEEDLLGEEIPVHAEAPLAGRTLAEAGVRERTGATVLGVRRGEARFMNPRPSLVLAVGDTLLAVGTPEALTRLRRLAEPPSRDAGPHEDT
ncbi:MAG TPA: TrkA C-terminal domain-containing protein, partial [Candidatus Thermoplasmatota archaeon]|nr:TrkA C-terminal domain-containing protein [Candidatus Thermoplasmatota archaeon]